MFFDFELAQTSSWNVQLFAEPELFRDVGVQFVYVFYTQFIHHFLLDVGNRIRDVGMN